MAGFRNIKIMSNIKEERLKKLTAEGLSSNVIVERLGIYQSQVYYHQKRLGIWRGIKRKQTKEIMNKGDNE